MTLSRSGWIRIVALLVVVALLAVAWKWSGLRAWADPERLARLFEPYRTNWLAFPASIVVFIVAEFFLFPVTALVFVCGLAFGPWLGTLYALVGSLASAVVPFLIGRRLGRERLQHVGGAMVTKLEHRSGRKPMISISCKLRIDGRSVPCFSVS